MARNFHALHPSRPRPVGPLSSPPLFSISRLISWGGIALFLLAAALFVTFVRTGSVFGSKSDNRVVTADQRPRSEVSIDAPAFGADEPEPEVYREVRREEPPITFDSARNAKPDVAVEKSKQATVVQPAAAGIALPFAPIPASDSAKRRAALPTPHGGELVNLMVSPARRQELESDIASGAVAFGWTLTQRQLCDIELLLNGGFSPLRGFLSSPDLSSVLLSSRLSSRYGSVLWPMPITLDVDNALAARLKEGLEKNEAPRMALRDEYHNLIAVMTVEDVYKPDKVAEAQAAFGTADPSHPAAGPLLSSPNEYYIGGTLEGIALPRHFDFPGIRRTPAEVRQAIVDMGWPRTVAFQTRNPMHRAHIELTKLAAVEGQAGVLIHPSVGMTKPGDVEASVRVRCYQAMIASNRYYAEGGVILSLLPLAMRMAGPKEALWHAIIRKNFGASHFIVGRDHAGCKSAAGKDFYGAYDAQNLVSAHEKELGITILKYTEVEYVPRLDQYLPGNKIPEGEETLSISGTKFRGMMNKGDPIPAWFSDPDVIKILRELMPPLYGRGFAIFFTGLSGGGKTTIAHGLIQRLSGLVPTRRITFLDGDVVRTHLSKGLGFSISDRNTNVARIGWVASEAVKHGGIVLASAIAPFAEGRRSFKASMEAAGGAVFQVYVASSLGVCAQRDVKGLYELAANGKTDLTGVSHPYELPDDGTDLVIDTEKISVDSAVAMIISMLTKAGYINADPKIPNNVAADLSMEEKQLLEVLADETAVVPSSVAELRPAFISGKKDIAASAAGGLGPEGTGLCSDTWDLMEITKGHGSIKLYGGMPMKASIAYRVISEGIQRDSDTGNVQTPPDHVLLGLAHGVVADLLRFVLSRSVFLKQGGESAPIFALNADRLLATETLAALGAVDEKAAEAKLNELMNDKSNVKSAISLTTLDVDGNDNSWPYVSDPHMETGTHITAALPEAGRLYAAFDLWTNMRWYRQVNEDTHVNGKRGRSAFVAPRLLPYAAQILRLDPCARVVAIVPATGSEAMQQLIGQLSGGSATPATASVDGRKLLAIGAPKKVSPVLAVQAAKSAAPSAPLPSVDAAVVDAYLQAYVAGVAQLAATFPERVLVLTADDDDFTFAQSLRTGDAAANLPQTVQEMINAVNAAFS